MGNSGRNINRERATSVEDGNSTDGMDKAGRTIAALSTKELTKPNGPMKHGKSDTGRRNGSAEDRKPARSEDTNLVDGIGKGRKDAPVQELEKARDAIATLATTDGSIRRNKSPKDRMPTRPKVTKGVDGTGQGRKDSLEKRILAASQTAEAPESLRYPELKESTSEDSVTQEETEQSMAKGCIETVDDERTSDLEMRLGYLDWDYTTGWRSQRPISYWKSSARSKDDQQGYCWTQGVVHTYFRPVLQNGMEFQEFG